MTPTLETIYQAALALPEEERAELLDRLCESLPQNPPSQLHPAWREELRRRVAQIDSGKIVPVAWEEVQRLAWEAVKQNESDHHGKDNFSS